jgi:hypothetical protein
MSLPITMKPIGLLNNLSLCLKKLDHYSCPGYVIDHIKALACGGADAPRNMQWQSIAAGKEKDGWERIGCKTKSTIKLAAISLDYYTGSKGGCYTYNKRAKKRYVDPSFCRDKS